MDEDPRNWEGQSIEDIYIAAREFDPLAELAAELAQCCEAITNNSGTFCTTCKCQLQYHLPYDESNVCELCGCEEIYTLCISCGKGRPLDQYQGSKTCSFCHNIPPVRIRPIEDGRKNPSIGLDGPPQPHDDHYSNRSKMARLALKELTE